MIIYFSATGNCKHVANEISKKTGDTLVDITECMREKQFEFELKEDESIGLVTPTYDWILPSIVDEFLGKTKINGYGNHYVYFIATYGTTIGQTFYLANEHMKAKGYPFDAYFSVKMPDTWTPVFNLSDKGKVKKQNEEADRQIEGVVDQILRKDVGDFAKMKLPGIIRKPMMAKYEKVRRTSHLHVNDNCIGCGLCKKKCPVSAIEMKDGKPIWIKEQCVMCIGCLHRCPKFAIQYDNRTQKHGQYVHP